MVCFEDWLLWWAFGCGARRAGAATVRTRRQPASQLASQPASQLMVAHVSTDLSLVREAQAHVMSALDAKPEAMAASALAAQAIRPVLVILRAHMAHIMGSTTGAARTIASQLETKVRSSTLLLANTAPVLALSLQAPHGRQAQEGASTLKSSVR